MHTVSAKLAPALVPESQLLTPPCTAGEDRLLGSIYGHDTSPATYIPGHQAEAQVKYI